MKVIIIGGGASGLVSAIYAADKGCDVTIIEKNAEVCEGLCEALDKCTVVCADGTDQEVLLEEGLLSVDAFISLTGMDEQNILMSAYAQSKGVPKIITKINREALIPLAENWGIDTVVSSKNSVSNILVRYARALENSQGSSVETLYKLMDDKVEVLEFKVKDDFEKFADVLLEEDTCTFLYRDFNARNVMVKDGEPYFIDFQGGRRGPIYYDVASFAWQARAKFSHEQKEAMLDAYLAALSEYMPIDAARFRRRLRLFILFRLLQVLGAYGFRGWVEHKANFVTSIPAAIAELKMLAEEGFDEYPYLTKVLGDLAALSRFQNESRQDGVLEVKVYSFSFKKGVPHDPSGNGGGYVFDCRSIHNPGRYEPYKKLTGRDEPVIRFLEDDGEVFGYLEHVYGIVDPHVETYSRRGFTNLMVSFGCTGGQHRSVYCAEHLAAHLLAKYPHIRVRLIHREQKMLQRH